MRMGMYKYLSMKQILIALLILLQGLCTFNTLADTTKDNDIRRNAVVTAIEQVMPCVVNISTETVVERRGYFEDLLREFYGPYYGRKQDVRYSLGSGVIIDEEGYILTNLHVVQRASKIWVSLSDGRKLEAEQISNLTGTDVALLKIKPGKNEKFSAIRFAKENDLLLGETVIALGNPFGLGGSVSQGILSSKNRRPNVEGADLNIEDWLQTDAAINPGNSGGPLVNLNGDLIGLNVAIYREGQGIGFAIPIKAVSEALSLMLTPENTGALWFGGVLAMEDNHLVFKSIEENSPAALAGIQPGDILVTINKTEIKGLIQANQELIRNGAKEINLLLKRENAGKKVTVALQKESAFFNFDYIQKRTGLKLEKITQELAQNLGIQMADAFVIMGVEEGEATEIGLQPGMIVYALNGERISDPVEFARNLYTRPPKQKITLGINIQRQTGMFIQQRNVNVEITLK